MTQKITVTAQVEIPRVPNFLRMTDGKSLPVYAASEKSLREIGALWTEALVQRAKEQGERTKP